ncbi:MAG: hypothetical protein HUU20_17395, partial [Pirellulales bacterium]|nr:hypothetical protein [Pirellulales bacterium]
MPRTVPLTLILCAFLLPSAPAGDLDDFHWREPFDHVEAWSARPDWLSEPSATATVSGDGQTACFQVQEPRRGMKWSRPIPVTSLKELPYLVVRYRAENLDTTSTDYLLYLDDRKQEQLSPLRLCDAAADGQWHVAAVDLGSLADSDAVYAMAVHVRAGSEGKAKLWLDSIALTDDVP